MQVLWSYLAFGFKNLWRRKSRTLLLGISFFVLVFILAILFGYGNGLSKTLTSEAVNNYIGDYALMDSRSRFDCMKSEAVYPFDSDIILNKLSNTVQGEISKRYRTIAFMYTKNIQRISYLMGIDKVSYKRLRINGKKADVNGPGQREIVVSEVTAKELKLKIGDTIAVEVVSDDGIRNFDYF
ncbi:MAG: hypothetical protein D6707_10170, partial [Bacteroidetes bacterium]